MGEMGDMGGGGEAAGGEGGGIGGMLGGGEEASSMPSTDYSGMGSEAASGASSGGGGGVGMLSFAVSDNMAGLSGADTSSTKVSTTPSEAGAGLSASTKPANAGPGSQAGIGSGTGIGTGKGSGGPNSNSEPGETMNVTTSTPKDNMAVTAAKAFSKEMQKEDNTPSSLKPYSMPANTYGALFGSTNMMGKQSSPSMQMPAIQNVEAAPAMAQIPQVPMGASLPTPMPLQMQSAQAQQIPQMQAPMPPQLGAVSDMRAKQNIHSAPKEVDEFLQKVYNNVVSRKGKR